MDSAQPSFAESPDMFYEMPIREISNLISPESQQSMPPAQTLYHVSREGVENSQPIPVGRAKPWKSLPKVASASLNTWLLRCGDVVSVNVGYERLRQGF